MGLNRIESDSFVDVLLTFLRFLRLISENADETSTFLRFRGRLEPFCIIMLTKSQHLRKNVAIRRKLLTFCSHFEFLTVREVLLFQDRRTIR